MNNFDHVSRISQTGAQKGAQTIVWKSLNRVWAHDPGTPLGCATKFDFREILLPAVMQFGWPMSQKSQYKDIFRTKEIQQCAHIFKANYCFNVYNARHFCDKYYRLGYNFPFQTLVGRFGSLFSYCDDCKSAVYANIVKITNNQTTLRGSGL